MATKARIDVTARDDTKAAFDSVSRRMSGLEKSAGLIKGAFVGIGAGLLAGLGGGALAGLFRQITAGVAALNDLSQATGATVENLSALEDIGARTGTGFESVGNAVIKLNQALNIALETATSPQAKAFRALNIDIERLARLDPAQGLFEFAKTLNGFQQNAATGRAALLLLGRSIKELGPFIHDLAQAGQLNATVTTEQAQAADQFGDNLDALGKRASDAARRIAGPLVAAINKLFEPKRGNELVESLQDELEAIQGALDAVGADVFTQTAQNYERRINQIKRELKKAILSVQREGLPEPPKPDLAVNIAAQEALERRQKEAEKRQRESAATIKRYVDQLNAQIDKTRQLTEVERALEVLRSAGVKGGAKQQEVLALAKQIDALTRGLALEKGITEELKKHALYAQERGAALERGITEQLERQKSLFQEIDDLAGRTASKRKQELTRALEDRLNAGEVFGTEELERTVKAIAGINDELKDTERLSDKLGLSFASAFEDAIVQGGNLRDVLRGLEQDILRIVTRQLVTKPLADSIGGLLSGIKLFGSAAGNVFARGLVPFARGGVVNGPTMFAFGGAFGGRLGVMGEAGPEAVMPLKRGRDGRLGVQASGSSVVNITVNVPGGTDRAAANQIAASVAQRLALASGRNN